MITTTQSLGDIRAAVISERIARRRPDALQSTAGETLASLRGAANYPDVPENSTVVSG